MNEHDRKIHNAAIKDALRQVELMQGWTLSRKLTVKAIRSCLVKKAKKVESAVVVDIKTERSA